MTGSHELELLLRAVKPARDPHGEELIKGLARGALDWEILIALARHHRVSPALWHGLDQTVGDLLPTDTRNRLKTIAAAHLRRNLRIAHHATQLLDVLAHAGVNTIAFKGVFMAQTIYGRLSSREVNDIDLLIAVQDVTRSDSLLRSLDFELCEHLAHQRIYRCRNRQIEVDLHWQLAPDYFSMNMAFEPLWNRSTEEKLGAGCYRTFAHEDLLLILCVQIAKDCWERSQKLEHLQKVCDIAQLVVHDPKLDWTAIQRRAAQMGLTRVVHLALALAQALLHVELPQHMLHRIKQDRDALALARHLASASSLSDLKESPSRNSLGNIPLRIRQLWFYVRLRERQQDKWRHLGLIFKTLLRMVKLR